MLFSGKGLKKNSQFSVTRHRQKRQYPNFSNIMANGKLLSRLHRNNQSPKNKDTNKHRAKFS